MDSEGVGARIHRQPCIADGDSGFVRICESGTARKIGAVAGDCTGWVVRMVWFDGGDSLKLLPADVLKVESDDNGVVV